MLADPAVTANRLFFAHPLPHAPLSKDFYSYLPYDAARPIYRR